MGGGRLTKILIGSSVSQIAISESSSKRPPPISDHLTKIPISSSVSQIAISETSSKRPPPISDHLTKIPISSSVSQIAISETSHKRPPKPDIKGDRLWEVPLYIVHPSIVRPLSLINHCHCESIQWHKTLEN